jgi:hypothetical protein
MSGFERAMRFARSAAWSSWHKAYGSGADAFDRCLVQTLAPQDVEDLELTPEQQAEYERRAKQYSRRKMAEERTWQSDLSRRIKLKVRCNSPHWRGRVDTQRSARANAAGYAPAYEPRAAHVNHGPWLWGFQLAAVDCLQEAALAALPAALREAADQPDMTPFPLERMVPTHTPPIKGFGDRGRKQKSQA